MRSQEPLKKQGMPKILFLSRSLERGGAERQLVTLAAGLHQKGWPVSVACFYAGGAFQRDLERAGVKVFDLRKHGRWDVFGFLWRLLRLFRDAQPDVVHGYLPVPNMLALLARLVRPRTKVAWGVRASNMDLSQYDWLARVTFHAQCKLAHHVDLIIANSWAGMSYHIEHGFPVRGIQVIPNGIDTARFCFDAVGRKRLRAQWGIPQGALVIGLVGRLDPMKDHPNFLQAAACLAVVHPLWHFVCVGDGAAAYRVELINQGASLGLTGRLVWVGAHDDMVAAYSALDIACSSSSFGEGFPNVVAEAMACGRPCVVTNVGDSARVVGDHGVLVTPRDPAALAEGIEHMYRHMMREAGAFSLVVRERVVEQFSVDSLIQHTGAALQSVCHKNCAADKE